MATPTYLQLVTLSSAANGLQPESMEERILSVLSILASGQNPDGSANTGTVLQGTQLNLGTVGAAGATGSLVLYTGSGGSGGLIFIDSPSGLTRWQIYTNPSDNNLYIRDITNSKFQIILRPNAVAANANTEINSTVRVDALPAFVAGDHYVTADSSGNLHLSSLGPAS